VGLGETGQTHNVAWQEELAELHTRIAPRFARQKVRERARHYLAGLLESGERRTGSQMAKHIGELSPDGVQRLLNSARWDADLVRNDLRGYVIERLGDPVGVLVITEVGFPKKGTKSVGVARQHNPSTGRYENCQVAVFLAYASPRGLAFIDQALYLPEEWAEDEERCREAGVPEQVGYVTKSELAWEMLDRAFKVGVPSAWVTGIGEAYGTDEGLRRQLRGQSGPHVLEVERSNRLLTVVDGVPVWRWWEALAPDAFTWERVDLGIGSESSRAYRWARGRLPRETTAGWAQWLLVRRPVTLPKREFVYYHAYGPEQTPLAKLAQVASTSWLAEESLERAKDEVGLDQYEVRRWDAWHRHATLCLLAHASLQVTRAEEREVGRGKGVGQA
jgi:SRSO17 transposase